MNMKKTSSIFIKIFYYVMASILVLFALGPITWMIDTSFKTNSEALSWPPRFGTINALSTRTLNAQIETVRTSQSVNPSALSLESLLTSISGPKKNISRVASPETLIFRILGASGYRGTDTLPRRGKLILSLVKNDGSAAMYITKMATPRFNATIQKLNGIKKVLPGVASDMGSLAQYSKYPYDYALNFYDDFLYGSKAIFDRITFIKGLTRVLEKTGINEATIKKIKKFQKGTRLLSNADLQSLLSILNGIRKSHSNLSVIEEYTNSISLYHTFDIFYRSLQTQKIDQPIVVSFIPNSHKMRIISAPSIVKSVYQSGEELRVNFKNTNFVSFLNDKIEVTAHYSLWQVLSNFFENYLSAWNSAPFGIYYFNSILVSGMTTLINIIIDTMMAFAFSKLPFRGRDKLFVGIIATMMIPYQVLLVANYLTIHSIGWLNTYYSLIIPWSASAFVIFLMRQSFNSIPNDLYDAAKIDGASSWRFLWTIVVPLSKSVIITGALLTFLGSWNSFLWVLVMTDSTNMRTLPVGLQNFVVNSGTIFNQLMAAATFTMIPVVIVFLFLQRYFVSGMFRSGIK